MRGSGAAEGADGYPRRSYAWYVVAVLIGTAIVSYTDRQVLSLLLRDAGSLPNLASGLLACRRVAKVPRFVLVLRRACVCVCVGQAIPCKVCGTAESGLSVLGAML